MRIIRLDDTYSHIRPSWWLEHMDPPTKGLQGCDDLLDELRKHRPVGTIESHEPRPVILAPGKAVGLHSHKQSTLIYFIDAEDVPLIVDGITIWPANNTALLLEPGTPHEVTRNQTLRPRLSLALRFKYAGE